MTFYTFRNQVKLLPGQVIRFLAGKGYYAYGKVVQPPVVVMYDSIDLSQIPAGAPAVAGYVGGNWPTFAKLASTFPNAKRKSIAVNAAEDAEVLDIETGDARIPDAPAWYRRQVARGVAKPGLYCQVSNAAALIAAMRAAGVDRSAYDLWTAHYTYRAHRCNWTCGFGMSGTADATQWTDKALGGRNLDQSLCVPAFFG